MFSGLTVQEATSTVRDQVGEVFSHTPTNSSVQNTDLKIDWFQFHLPNNSDSWFVLQNLFPDMQEAEKSCVPGYEKTAFVLGSGKVAWSDNQKRKDNRIFVQLPSTALSMLKKDLYYLMWSVRAHGGTFSRLDFAFDSFGLLDIDLIEQKLADHEVQTRWKTYTPEEGKKAIGSIEGEGKTVYVGDRRSESFLRVYDKTAEQMSKLGRSGASQDELEAVPGDWVRVELESKKRKADALAVALIQAWEQELSPAEVVVKHLYSLIDFKEVGRDSNRSRWLTCDWWLEFLDSVVKQAVKLPPTEFTLKRLFTWINHIAPALSVAASVDIDWLLGEIAAAQKRFRAKHKMLLREAGISPPGVETDLE